MKYLGSGYEGAVYIARNDSGKKFIVKAFYPNIVQELNYDGLGGIFRKPVPGSGRDLLRLSKSLNRDRDALYAIRLIENCSKVGLQT